MIGTEIERISVFLQEDEHVKCDCVQTEADMIISRPTETVLSKRNLRLFAVTLMVATFLVACGDDDAEVSDGSTPGGSTISGTLTEWDVQVDRESIGAGDVVFSITNEGSIVHEFVVVKTEMADGQIPLDGDRFDEGAVGVEAVDEIENLAVGSTSELSVTLSSGKYQLVCNLPGHYQAGMHTSLTVTE
jgi:plastocyanin